MSARQMTDSVFDALFGQAVIDIFYDELNSLPTVEELTATYKPSRAHSFRMKKIFTAEKRKEKVHTVFIWCRRIVAVIMIATTILFGSLMFVPEVRAAVIETIVEWHEKFVRFTSGVQEAEKTNLEPSYIPEGFDEETRESTDTILTILFTSTDGRMIIFQSSLSGGSLSSDSENRDYEIRRIDGIDYHILAADSDSNVEVTIVWEDLGQRYFIYSTISTDETLKIALSVS